MTEAKTDSKTMNLVQRLNVASKLIKTTFAVNKAELKKALQSGRDVPNARLVENVSLGVK